MAARIPKWALHLSGQDAASWDSELCQGRAAAARGFSSKTSRVTCRNLCHLATCRSPVGTCSMKAEGLRPVGTRQATTLATSTQQGPGGPSQRS